MAQSVFATDKIQRISGALWSALPEDIILPPIELSGRKSYEEADIASMAADIFKRQQDTPVKIRKNDKGKPILVYGRRRYLAVQYANKHLVGSAAKIRLEAVYESNMSDTDALIAAISENHKRKDVNDMDHSFNITTLLKRFKQTLEQVAEIYFPDAVGDKAKADALRWVRERAGLTELTPEAADAVRAGELPITNAKELAKLPPDVQREVVAEAKSKPKLAGKTRIKVKDIKAKKTGKPAPAGKKAPAPAPAAPAGPAPKLPTSVYEAAEDVMVALDEYKLDATEPVERKLWAAHAAYRKLQPARKSSKAA